MSFYCSSRFPARAQACCTLVVVEEEVLGKAYDARLMRRLLAYMRPYKSVAFLALVFLLFNSVFEVMGPLLTKVAVDKYLAPSPGSSAGVLEPYLSSDPLRGIAQISVLYLCLLVAGLVSGFVQTYAMQWTGQHAMFDLRRNLVAHLQKLDIDRDIHT